MRRGGNTMRRGGNTMRRGGNKMSLRERKYGTSLLIQPNNRTRRYQLFITLQIVYKMEYSKINEYMIHNNIYIIHNVCRIIYSNSLNYFE